MGSKNKRTLAKDVAIKDGVTPLVFFEQLMRGETVKLPNGEDYEPTFEDMKWGASKAAPYRHPTLQSVEHSGGVDVNITHEQALDELK